MDRFDIPNEVKSFITVAIENRIIDTFDVYALAIKYNDDWRGLIDEVCLYAFNNRHVNGDSHKNVVKAAEVYWMAYPAS